MSNNIDFIYDNEEFVDLYGILNVDPESNSDTIKSSYLKLVKEHHPDHGGNSDFFQQITKAYEILHNKESRKEYDIYFLKKSFEEFQDENIFKLKKDFTDFVNSNTKPVNEEKLNEIMKNVFKDREEYKEKTITESELMKRINDINFERENTDIEANDERVFKLINDNKKKFTVDELYEYVNLKNTNNNKQITNLEIGTLDTLPGYGENYSSFICESENLTSNIYTDINNEEMMLNKDSINTIDIDDFKKWKTNKNIDKKLSLEEINSYVEKRKLDEKTIFKNVDTQLKNSTKKKEVQKFLNKKNLSDEIN